jgi:hypothetical protein
MDFPADPLSRNIWLCDSQHYIVHFCHIVSQCMGQHIPQTHRPCQVGNLCWICIHLQSIYKLNAALQNILYQALTLVTLSVRIACPFERTMTHWPVVNCVTSSSLATRVIGNNTGILTMMFTACLVVPALMVKPALAYLDCSKTSIHIL